MEISSYSGKSVFIRNNPMTLSTRTGSSEIRFEREGMRRNIVSISVDIVVFASSIKIVKSRTTSSDNTRIRINVADVTIRRSVTSRTI